ncbi:MAG TPA: hypothetical protein VE842_05250 [Pyrinomonadaceae bacterium]|jgi:hypothetical protein|nr:hypothetical protein [Pyrinomonadaceae bacterium]
MAARGTRNMDAGEESIGDETIVSKLRERARKIHRRALASALAITMLALIFP